jgi:hypothetical protein
MLRMAGHPPCLLFGGAGVVFTVRGFFPAVKFSAGDRAGEARLLPGLRRFSRGLGGGKQNLAIFLSESLRGCFSKDVFGRVGDPSAVVSVYLTKGGGGARVTGSPRLGTGVIWTLNDVAPLVTSSSSGESVSSAPFFPRSFEPPSSVSVFFFHPPARRGAGRWRPAVRLIFAFPPPCPGGGGGGPGIGSLRWKTNLLFRPFFVRGGGATTAELSNGGVEAFDIWRWAPILCFYTFFFAFTMEGKKGGYRASHAPPDFRWGGNKGGRGGRRRKRPHFRGRGISILSSFFFPFPFPFFTVGLWFLGSGRGGRG